MPYPSIVLEDSGQVKTGPGEILAITIAADYDSEGPIIAVVSLYDGIDTNGTMISNLSAYNGNSSHAFYPGGIVFSVGCYASISAGATVTIEYR